MRRRILTALTALAVLAIPVTLPRAEIIEEIAARVNDAIITRTELQSRRDQIARQLADRFEAEEYETRMRAAQDSLLFDMINEELLFHQARLMFDMDRYYENVKKEWMKVNDIKSEEELEELVYTETSEEEFRRLLLRSNVAPDVLQFEVARKISVSDQEKQTYYDEHIDEFRVHGEIELREIVILDEGRGDNGAQTVMDDILARLQAGESFEALASELSESSSRENGGLIGPFKEGELAPGLEQQAFALDVGQVGEPTRTSYGYLLIQVEEKSPSRVQSLPEVADQIENKIRGEKYVEQFDVYLSRLWTENRVRVNPRYAIGRLADGGPYSQRDAIVPEGAPMGAPDVLPPLPRPQPSGDTDAGSGATGSGDPAASGSENEPGTARHP